MCVCVQDWCHVGRIGGGATADDDVDECIGCTVMDGHGYVVLQRKEKKTVWVTE